MVGYVRVCGKIQGWWRFLLYQCPPTQLDAMGVNNTCTAFNDSRVKIPRENVLFLDPIKPQAYHYIVIEKGQKVETFSDRPLGQNPDANKIFYVWMFGMY